MKTWSLYSLADGMFTGNVLTGPRDEFIDLNIPEGHAAIEGHHDHLSRRVDLETGQVIDHQPPKPSDEHEWDDAMKRWTLLPDVQQRRARHAVALEAIEALERSQHRAIREAALGGAGALARLQAIDAEISALRASLS